MLETSSRFNYRNILGKLMYMYITCRPDIWYVITILSKSFQNHVHFITNFCVVWSSIFEIQSLGASNSIDFPLSTLTSLKTQSLILNLQMPTMYSLSMSTVLFFKSLLVLPLGMTSLEKDISMVWIFLLWWRYHVSMKDSDIDCL